MSIPLHWLKKCNKTNITFTVIISNVDNETCLKDIYVNRHRKGRKRAGKARPRARGGSEPNPTISPRVARFQLTIGCFISLQRVIAAFNHFFSLHGFFPLSVFPLLSSNPLLMLSRFPPHLCSLLPSFHHVLMEPHSHLCH